LIQRYIKVFKRIYFFIIHSFKKKRCFHLKNKQKIVSPQDIFNMLRKIWVFKYVACRLKVLSILENSNQTRIWINALLKEERRDELARLITLYMRTRRKIVRRLHTGPRARILHNIYYYYYYYYYCYGEEYYMCVPRSLLANLLFAVRSRIVVGGGDIRSYIIIHCIVYSDARV